MAFVKDLARRNWNALPCRLALATSLATLALVCYSFVMRTTFRASIVVRDSPPGQNPVASTIPHMYASADANSDTTRRYISAIPLAFELTEFISKNQHPSVGCAGQKYIRIEHNAGMGSVLNVNAMAFALALLTGRIFDWHPSALRHTDPAPGGLCKNRGHATCFFTRPSSCSSADAPSADVADMDYNDLMRYYSVVNEGQLERLPFKFGLGARYPVSRIDDDYAGNSTLVRACLAYLLRLEV